MTRRDRILQKHREERAKRAFNRLIRAEARIRRRQGLTPLPTPIVARTLAQQGKIPPFLPKNLQTHPILPAPEAMVKKPCGGCQAARRRMRRMKRHAEAKNAQQPTGSRRHQ